MSLKIPTVKRLREDLDYLINLAFRAQELEPEVAALRLVLQGLQGRKISPAQIQWALDYARRDPEDFMSYLELAPEIEAGSSKQ